jgi:hypothetical protein
MPLDLAIVPCSRRNVFVVWCALLNAILERLRLHPRPAPNNRGSGRQIQDAPDFSPSATQVTGRIEIADVRREALG